jgi:ATP-dependent RNA helicase SUPV3L1/SUV3
MPLSFTTPPPRDSKHRGAGVTAVLGPTNTGKTHLAIERMLAHSSGMIGLPLRLLAREVYNRVVERVGAENAALITGEEKIKPPNPRYWIATVEAMPRELDLAFVAIDEVQLGADFERGHVFTDRMLHRRGREETLVIGAATMRPIVEKLLRGANIISRPRLSVLTHTGDKKLTRLPRRSAIVAFSAEEVYAIAELIRRQHGGAAVVLGALSPRTRNAQVALFQAGDVDYLVATDAIGMGLNLDVDHVAFASDRKFDGYQYRRLSAAELAQIAGRAGRATRDGTFGTTGRCPPFEDELVRALETHTFEPVQVLQWRNTDLDFSSIGALQASLAMVPNEPGLTRAPVAEDILVLDHASRDDEIRDMARSRDAIERLWEVCQVPDYRKIAPATHAELVVTLYSFLMREDQIPVDWFARQVALADNTAGDIDTISNRIAHVRTWTFVANRPDWLADPEHWQGVTRAVEDKLSDALHERLTERFVDRRTSVLMRRLRENTALDTEIKKSGEVVTEGHVIGRLEGFRFTADAATEGSEAKALQAAARSALAGEIDARARRLSQAPDREFVLSMDGAVRWMGEVVAKLVAAEDVLRPRLRIVADEQLTGAAREAVQTRLDLWLKTHIERLLGPLFALALAEDVTGLARGIAFQLVESLGVLERQKVAEEVKSLDQPARAMLRRHGVRFGTYHIYVPALLKPAPRALAVQLWALKHGGPDHGLENLQHLAASGRTSIPVDEKMPSLLYRTAGYRVCGKRAIRVDILERLADLIRPTLAWREGAPGPRPPGTVDGRVFTVTGAMTSLIGAAGEDFASVLRALGYRMEKRPKSAVLAAQAPPPEPSAARVTESVSVEAAGATPDSDATAAIAEPSVTESAAGLASGDAPPHDTTEAPGDGDLPADHIESAGEDRPSALDGADAAAPATDAQAATAAASNLGEKQDESVPAATTAAATAAVDMVEVWRPGRPDANRRKRDRRKREERERSTLRPVAQGEGAAPAMAAASTGAEAARSRASASDPALADDPKRKFKAKAGKVRTRPQAGSDGEAREPRNEGPRRAAPNARPGQQRGRGEQGAPRSWSSDHRRGKEPDPNSPFAKLLALKERLEANGKDRR